MHVTVINLKMLVTITHQAQSANSTQDNQGLQNHATWRE